MRNGPGIWTLAFVTSAAINIGAGAGLLAALQPQPIENQPVPESRLNVEAQQVTRSDAIEREPSSQNAPESETQMAKLGVGAIAQSVAAPIDASLEPSAALQAPATRVDPTALPDDAATPTPMSAATVAAGKLLATQTSTTALQSDDALILVLNATKAMPRLPNAASVPQSVPNPSQALSQPPKTNKIAEAKPNLTASPQKQAARITAPQTTPDTTTTKAILAFPSNGPVDPVSLAAFQSFTQPGAAAGTDVRDSLSAALSLPCSRMQILFDPGETTLRLTGHLPDDNQRAPVLATLRAQMGNDIDIADNLLVLPAPQCAALSGIAGVGLPQSTDQITNPLIIGADTHARAFRYVAGDALVVELTAPDYPAYIYVDYFDADGNVIHLSPNHAAALQKVTPKSEIQIGAQSADAPGLFVTIGPPFGQEIAAAFASSVPLYEGLRPLAEPAGAYLGWLQERVAKARAQHPDFKGEWVYFFVTTAEN